MRRRNRQARFSWCNPADDDLKLNRAFAALVQAYFGGDIHSVTVAPGVVPFPPPCPSSLTPVQIDRAAFNGRSDLGPRYAAT